MVEVNQTASAELGFGLSVVSFSGEFMGQDRKSVDDLHFFPEEAEVMQRQSCRG